MQNLSQGFYGFTAISGKKKLGKTIIGLRASLEAAAAGWSTHYAYGENTGPIVTGYLARCLGEEQSAKIPAWMDRWRAFRFHPGHNIKHLIDNVVARILPDTERVLIGIDSINRLGRYSARGDSSQNYLRELGRICQVAQSACEESEGRIAFMVLSETNQRGGMVGMDVEYSAACLLYLRPTRDPAKVKMRLESRESRSDDLGVYVRDYENCRFKTMLAEAEENEEVFFEPPPPVQEEMF